MATAYFLQRVVPDVDALGQLTSEKWVPLDSDAGECWVVGYFESY